MREDKKQCESVGWQFYQQGKWWNGDDRIKDHRKNTEEAGIPTRDVFALSANAEPSAPVDPDQIALDCATEIMRLLDKLPIPGGRGQLKAQIQCRVCAVLERKP